MDESKTAKALSLEEQQSRIWDAWRAQFPLVDRPVPIAAQDAYIVEMYDDHIIVEFNGEHWSIGYTEDGDIVDFSPRDEWQKVKQERQWVDAKNSLKAISSTKEELRVGNYLVLYNTRDLEGNMSHRVNADGTKGEYFAPDTILESPYTKAGAVFVDWEHRQDIEPETKQPITGTFGVVDWKTAKSDDHGLWVERILDRRNWYVQKIESLIRAGLIGTSSEPMQDDVEKEDDGKISRWPLLRDTMTVAPMEYRMMKEFGENHLQAFKALGIPVPTDNEPVAEPQPAPEATPAPEHETSPEADAANEQRAAVDVAKARARLQSHMLSLEEQ